MYCSCCLPLYNTHSVPHCFFLFLGTLLLAMGTSKSVSLEIASCLATSLPTNCTSPSLFLLPPENFTSLLHHLLISTSPSSAIGNSTTSVCFTTLHLFKWTTLSPLLQSLTCTSGHMTLITSCGPS